MFFLPTTTQGFWHAIGGITTSGKEVFNAALFAQGIPACSGCKDALSDMDGWRECPTCENGQCESCCAEHVSCDSCGDAFTADEGFCADCDKCEHCCCCYYCDSCGNKVSDFCHDCDYCWDCCSCDEEGEFGSSKPFWETRDHYRPSKGRFGHWKEVWQYDPDTVDPVEVFADFYVTDGIMALSYQEIPSGPDVYRSDNVILKGARLAEKVAQAKALQSSLLENKLPQLVQYMKMAIWGEARFAKGLNNYDGWGTMGLDLERKYGAEAYREVARLFREFSEGCGYGGEAWAVPTDILADYIDGKIPPHTMMDRICTLQHNNKSSSIWDKVEWSTRNPLKWRHTKIPTHVGPAQACILPAWSILLAACSPEVRTLWEMWWNARNNLRRAWHLQYEPNPILPVETVKSNVYAIVQSHEGGRVWRQNYKVTAMEKPGGYVPGCDCEQCEPYTIYLKSVAA